MILVQSSKAQRVSHDRIYFYTNSKTKKKDNQGLKYLSNSFNLIINSLKLEIPVTLKFALFLEVGNQHFHVCFSNVVPA